MGFKERKRERMENEIASRVNKIDGKMERIKLLAQDEEEKLAALESEVQDLIANLNALYEENANERALERLGQTIERKQAMIPTSEDMLDICDTIQGVWEQLYDMIRVASRLGWYKIVLSSINVNEVEKMLTSFNDHELRNFMEWIKETTTLIQRKAQRSKREYKKFLDELSKTAANRKAGVTSVTTGRGVGTTKEAPGYMQFIKQKGSTEDNAAPVRPVKVNNATNTTEQQTNSNN